MAMKWAYLVVGLLGFGFGIIFTHLVQGYLDFSAIFPYIVGGISGGLSFGTILQVVGLLIGIYKGRKEKREKHAEVIRDALKEWIENIGFGDIEIKDGRLIMNEPREPDTKFSKQVMEHLKSGYSDVWRLWEKYKNMWTDESNRMRETWKQFETIILTEVTNKNPSLERWDGRSPKSLKWYFPERIFEFIQLEAKSLYKNRKRMYLPPQVESHPLGFVLDWNGTDIAGSMLGPGQVEGRESVRQEMEVLCQTLEQILDDPRVLELANSLHVKDFNENYKKFGDKISEIIENLELGVPLKGKCTPLGY